MKIGDSIEMKGFVTSEKYLLNQTLPEIEKRLGFEEGRLSQGATFLVAERMPQKGEFETKGYSQVAGHKHIPLDKQINTEGHPLEGYSKDALQSRAQNAMSEDRLIKVIPKIEHNPNIIADRQYPPGTGVPQWEVTSKIPFKVESIVEAGGKYVGQQAQHNETSNQKISIQNENKMDTPKENPKSVANIPSNTLTPKFNSVAEKSTLQSNTTATGGESKGSEKLSSGNQLSPSPSSSTRLKGAQENEAPKVESNNQQAQQNQSETNKNDNFRPR